MFGDGGSKMVKKAAAFAERAHRGAVRKGTAIPYITHPLEAAVIVASITEDQELIAAALLHDVMEDAGVSREKLKAEFGSRPQKRKIRPKAGKREKVTHLNISKVHRERKRLWFWGTNSAMSAVRHGITFFLGRRFGIDLMKSGRNSMDGTT